MKKRLLVITVLSVAMGLAACSSGNAAGDTADSTANSTEVTTAVDINTVTEATTEEGAEVSATVETNEADEETTDVFDLEYVEGFITKINGSTVTVKDEFEDTDLIFDVSDANVIRTFPLTVGDYVEVAYSENADGGVLKAEQLEVIEAVLAESEEPLLIGTVQESTANTLTIETETGETYEFEISNAYIVAANGITNGKKVQVNFLGDPEFDEILMATRVVTEDSYSDPKAALHAFIGEIDSVEEQGLVLVSASGDYYTFVSPDIDFSAFASGETVQVTYIGSLSGKEIQATAVERN